jgi:hypothetical protein
MGGGQKDQKANEGMVPKPNHDCGESCQYGRTRTISDTFCEVNHASRDTFLLNSSHFVGIPGVTDSVGLKSRVSLL